MLKGAEGRCIVVRAPTGDGGGPGRRVVRCAPADDGGGPGRRVVHRAPADDGGGPTMVLDGSSGRLRTLKPARRRFEAVAVRWEHHLARRRSDAPPFASSAVVRDRPPSPRRSAASFGPGARSIRSDSLTRAVSAVVRSRESAAESISAPAARTQPERPFCTARQRGAKRRLHEPTPNTELPRPRPTSIEGVHVAGGFASVSSVACAATGATSFARRRLYLARSRVRCSGDPELRLRPAASQPPRRYRTPRRGDRGPASRTAIWWPGGHRPPRSTDDLLPPRDRVSAGPLSRSSPTRSPAAPDRFASRVPPAAPHVEPSPAPWRRIRQASAARNAASTVACVKAKPRSVSRVGTAR